MYFVVIMAFALVLSDDLPPRQLNLFAGRPLGDAVVLWGTISWAVVQIVLVALVSWLFRRRTIAALDGTVAGQDTAGRRYSRGQFIQLAILAIFLILTLVCTPWARIVRQPDGWNLDRIPLVGDLMLLAPFFASLTIAWIVQYAAEHRLKSMTLSASAGQDDLSAGESGKGGSPDARAALTAARRSSESPESSLGSYLLDKFRHQVLIIAAPMVLIVLAKHFTDQARPSLFRTTGLPWVSDAILGAASIAVLVLAPVMLRYIWATEPLPPGPLRERFESTCRRIGLRYREILLWHTHGMTVNAAVMGFIPPLRYILVSDALLETLSEEEIEAVFAHEAGHVHHWHLPFFGAFAATSMYLSGGVVMLLDHTNIVRDYGLLQLAGLCLLLAIWLFGFGWLSRRFERQADLFGVRCITPDVSGCLSWCPVHGERRSAGLCVSAANIFGRTLCKIASLNGIPRKAPSWRHGSIESRCRLIEHLTAEPHALTGFDRSLVRVKAALAVATLIGTIGAAVIYYDGIAKALGWRA
ncbi:MAG: hypothetical protein DCC65_02325 [Planctomycetota bacterium]|nr:MAG: hypothetical protein DCC65_02325 [Planctomycetota bacterium]